ncbi:unnamed protein product [Cochlearia groenlandica]
MVVFRKSTILAKDDLFVFPPINHENLQVASSIYLETPSESSVESPPSDSNCKSPWHLESEIIRDWWQLLLVRASSKLKNLFTWFSTNLRSYYPVLAIVIWWWMRVRARRRRVTTDNLRNSIEERDQRIVQLLHQIAEMNELLIKQHKDNVSRR